MAALAKSGSKERGIFNRGSLKTQLPERHWQTFEKHWQTADTNPCGEIILRNKQFCNFTEVVCQPEEPRNPCLKKSVRQRFLGTYQATLTNFPYISKDW